VPLGLRSDKYLAVGAARSPGAADAGSVHAAEETTLSLGGGLRPQRGRVLEHLVESSDTQVRIG